MVLLQVDQLLPHSFDLALDVHPGHVGVIQDFLQPCNVGLHRLPDGRLIVEPTAAQEQGRNVKFQELSAPLNNVPVNLLDFEVICSETGVVNLEHVTSVVCNPVKDLERKM